MEPRPTISKSSAEGFDQCELRYFIEYKLKYRDSSVNVKTVTGSAVHAVAEALARIKKNIQDGGPNFIETEDIGTIDYDPETWLTPRTLSQLEIDSINKKRTLKSTFCDQKRLKGGHIRHGEELVEEIIQRVFDHYLVEPIAEAYKKGKKDLFERNYREFCWMLLEEFDPRFQNVVEVEKYFDIPLPWDWAILDNGEPMRTVGYIDIITEPIPGTYVILDYKTGSRTDFVTNKLKEYSDIKNDLQLCLYSYALNNIFPDKKILCDLFFVRDGGIFTVGLDPSKNAKEVESRLSTHVEKVKNCTNPKLMSPNILNLSQDVLDNLTWGDLKKKEIASMCMYMCPAFQAKDFGTDCNCKFISNKISEIGIDEVQRLYKKASPQ
jgi:ATP-dependent helicase/DNAse subunit B